MQYVVRFAGFCNLCYVTRAISPIPLEINRLSPHEPWLTRTFFCGLAYPILIFKIPIFCVFISNQDVMWNRHK